MRAYLSALLFLSPIGWWAAAQEARESAEVTVQQVRFATVRDQAGRSWLQAEVEVRVSGGGSGRGGYADRVQVSLAWGTEVDEALGGFEFYQATATAVSLGAGRSAFRFYLPPEIVARDRLQNSQRYWAVSVNTAGNPVPDSRRSVGSGFSSPAALENFRQQVRERAGDNAGVLLPEYLTPFAQSRDAEAPVMLRPETNLPLAR